jgi:prepilin-type N-terminal cleavage/methylation domain-containing protein
MEYRIQNITQNTEHRIQNTPYSVFSIPYSSKQGFSMLELLIYIAILSGLMVIISDMFIELSRGRGQAEAKSEVNSSIRFAAERIRQDLKGASVLTTPSLGTASSTLVATVAGVVIRYDVATGTLRRQEGVGATPVAVSGSNVFVSAPTFTRLENYNTTLLATTTSLQVAMTFQYNSSSTDWKYSDSLRTAVTLR